MISCYETGLPHCLDPHTLNTLGPDDLGGQLKLKTLAAHFRLDMEKEVCVCVCVHGRACVRTRMHVCMYTRIYVYVYTCASMHACTRVDACVCVWL